MIAMVNLCMCIRETGGSDAARTIPQLQDAARRFAIRKQRESYAGGVSICIGVPDVRLGRRLNEYGRMAISACVLRSPYICSTEFNEFDHTIKGS